MLTSIALKLAALTRHVLPAHRQDWARAMMAEIQGLSGGQAVRFALGCLFAAIWQTLVDHRFEPAMRGALVIVAALWASAKLVIPVSTFHSDALIFAPISLGLLLSALCYLAIAFGVARRRAWVWEAGLVAAFALNTSFILTGTISSSAANALWLALSVEEAVTWGVLVLSLMGWLRWKAIKPKIPC